MLLISVIQLQKDKWFRRVDMSFANINMSYSELMNVFRDEKYSRLPVYSKDTDHIVGIVNLKMYVLPA